MASFQECNFGWPELFFAAGLLLRSDPGVRWQKMASSIHGSHKQNKNEVAALFEFYSGKELFPKSTGTRVRTAQLKKGARIRMQNGLEAIVVRVCDGHTLVAKVFGLFTETGSIYSHNIVATELEGKWVVVEITPEQIKFSEEIGEFLQ